MTPSSLRQLIRLRGAQLGRWWLRSRVRHERLAALARRLLRVNLPTLSVVADADVDGLARDDHVLRRRLLVGDLPETTTAGDVLAAVDRSTLVGPAAIALERPSRNAGDFTAAVHQVVVLEQATSPHRVRAALIAIRRQPERLSPSHARTIARRALSFASQPIDPYAPVSLHTAAAGAAAAVIAARPEFDDILCQALAGQPGLRPVAASAVQGRRLRPEMLLAELLGRMAPTDNAALGFAQSCDRWFSALDPLVSPTPGAALRRQARSIARLAQERGRRVSLALAALAITALSAGLGLMFDAWILDLPKTLRLEGGPGLAAFAVLVAVHLVSAELAAERLPGPVARATSAPLPLKACYGLAAAGLAVGQLSPRALEPAIASALTYGLLIGFLLSLPLALARLLKRTDATKAAEAFVRRRRQRAIAAGRSLGALHRRTFEVRELVTALPWIRSALAEPLAERRVPILVPTAGWLSISARRLRATDRDGWWRSSAGRVWLVTPMASRVDAEQEVASVVTTEGEPLPARQLRQIRRLFSVSVQRPAEDAAEAVGVLVELMVRLGDAGNEAGGMRVMASAVDLVEGHLRGLRDARGAVQPGAEGASVPALRTAALATAQALGVAHHPATHEVLLRFAQRLLALVDDRDPFCHVLLGELDRLASSRAPAAIQLTWNLGARMLQLPSPLLSRSWVEGVRRMAARNDLRAAAINVGGHVLQLSPYIDAGRATRLFGELWSELDLTRTLEVRVAIRMGACCVRAGHFSLAAKVALGIKNVDMDPWRRWTDDYTAMGVEQAEDGWYGSTLGPDPQLSLQRFLEFSSAVAAAVPAATAAAN